MALKKRNIVTINLTDEAMFALQSLGYVNGRKNATGKGTSKFVCDLIMQHVSITYPIKEREVREKVILLELNSLQRSRNKLEDQIKVLAAEFTHLKEANKEKSKYEPK